MKLKNWKDLVELVGIAAIVVSLFFVGLELRQNTDAVKASSIDGLSSLSQEFYLLMASDPELTRIFRDGRQDMGQLGENDLARFFWIERSRVVRLQTAFLQWQRGTLGDQDWLFYRSFVCRESERQSWDSTKTILVPEFVAYSESC
jgi:hypothetical protein